MARIIRIVKPGVFGPALFWKFLEEEQVNGKERAEGVVCEQNVWCICFLGVRSGQGLLLPHLCSLNYFL